LRGHCANAHESAMATPQVQRDYLTAAMALFDIAPAPRP
jgi:hypothetical protein